MRKLSVVVRRKQRKLKQAISKPKQPSKHITKRTTLPFLTLSSFKLKRGEKWYE